jgi:hypothetical protein
MNEETSWILRIRLWKVSVGIHYSFGQATTKESLELLRGGRARHLHVGPLQFRLFLQEKGVGSL